MNAMPDLSPQIPWIRANHYISYISDMNTKRVGWDYDAWAMTLAMTLIGEIGVIYHVYIVRCSVGRTLTVYPSLSRARCVVHVLQFIPH